MIDLTRKPVLVLNSSYEPIAVCSGRRALKMIYKGVAKSIEDYPIMVSNARVWDEENGDYIDVAFWLPSVIRLMTYRHIPIRMPIVTRTNIFNRDKNTCGYCNRVFSKKNLTLDHIIPQSRGGKNTWENLVSCCLPCNKRKGDKLLSELTDMRLVNPPKQLHSHTRKHILRNMGAELPEWQKYLYYSSEGETTNAFS